MKELLSLALRKGVASVAVLRPRVVDIDVVAADDDVAALAAEESWGEVELLVLLEVVAVADKFGIAWSSPSSSSLMSNEF